MASVQQKKQDEALVKALYPKGVDAMSNPGLLESAPKAKHVRSK